MGEGEGAVVAVPPSRRQVAPSYSSKNSAGTSGWVKLNNNNNKRSDGRRAADVAQLRAQRQVEIVDGVAAVRLEQAGHA